MWKKTSYHASLVAKGFTQKEGIDYNETFSPVVWHSILRLLIALRFKLRYLASRCCAALLHGILEDTLCMKQPEGFIKPGEENKVLKLNRAICGLK